MSDTSSPPQSPTGLHEGLRDSVFRTFVEAVGDYAIFVLDENGRVVTWNRGAQRIKGYTASEIVGEHISRFYPPESKAHADEMLAMAAATGASQEEGWRVRKDGTRFWASVVITALRESDGRLIGYSKITRDLTERRGHEEQLRMSEERFRLLVEGVEDYGIFMLDPEGRVSSWNAGAQRILGYTPDEVIGDCVERFYPPRDAAAGVPSTELRNARLYRHTHEIGWRMRKGDARFWADVTTTSLTDDEGRHHGFALVIRDMSERKRMEALEEEGRRVNEFLAMLAHELRNPLAPIRNAVSILGLVRDVSPQVTWCRDIIERQAAQLSHLVDDLLDVSRVTRGKLHINGEPMDLNAAVLRALEAARPLIDRRRHHLDVRLGAEPIVVNGDMTRLTQVVLNILNNAAKYTPEGGKIEVEVKAERAEGVILVKDNGLGISPALLERVFDLFAQGERTLDRAEGGLGIGLTLVRRLVALHGGNVVAESEGPGRGSTFAVRLPRLDLMLPHRESGPGGIARAARPRSILVVDDNADSATSIAMFLRMLGHDVEIENSGGAALTRIDEGASPEIVLLDIGLPGIDGYEVARRLRAKPRGGDMRLYAMTGYGQDEDRQRSADAGFDAHLVKPLVPGDLARLIDTVPETAG